MLLTFTAWAYRSAPQRLDLMLCATAKSGGVYLYANQQGCDGGRLYFDGCAAVVVNGSLVAQVSNTHAHTPVHGLTMRCFHPFDDKACL